MKKLTKAKIFEEGEDLAKKEEEFKNAIEHATGEKNTHSVEITETSVTTIEKKTGKRMKIEILK